MSLRLLAVGHDIMNTKLFIAAFVTIFLAELGDKTQLATMLLATKEGMSKTMVFVAASLALICASGMAVIVGGWLTNWVDPKLLASVAGIGFILIGCWTLWSAWH